MQLTITKDFLFAHRGVEVAAYTKGQEVETDDQDLIETATAEGWATAAKAKKAPENKAKSSAPENKGAGQD